MKSILHQGAVLGLSCPLLSLLAIAHASPPPADSVQFCAFDDHHRWVPDHPRPAARPLANLNVGEPRTVRMIYFLPNDWSYRAEVVDSMKTVIKQSQAFYREQMQAHGHGDWTFGIETDAQGEPLVHRVDGHHPFSHYDNTLGWAVMEELEQTFDLDANIYFIVLGTDALRQGDGQRAGGVGRRRTKNGGYLVVPDRFGFLTVAHELGHTFGLYHDFRDSRYIMSYGHDQRGILSACAAEFLSAHAYFNLSVPIAEAEPPKVEIISSTRYEPGSTSVPVRLRVSDSEGLHQVGMIGTSGWCRGLARETGAVVEFDYDGSYGQRGFTSLSDQAKHNLLVVAVDTDGNVSETWFSLVETSPYEIDRVRGPLDNITSVAFSPDGALLAYGSRAKHPRTDAAVVLWDVETREDIAEMDATSVPRVAFSRDGTLAFRAGDRVALWDVATRKEIATLKAYSPMAFSRDGTLLASRGWWQDPPHSIKLWDIAGRTLRATLEGHTDQINALAFSPDGALLASGSGNGELGDDAVRLWDVASRKEIAAIEVPGDGVWSVAFSPDGTILAWGAARGGVTLWDVVNRKEIAFVEIGGPPVAFSPAGATLFFNSGGGTITLWDVGSREEIVTLAGESPDATSISLSSDGTMLAAGSWWDGTITLWDVSEWTGPRPFALEIVSGDGQQGAPGVALPHPLVVEVRDQYGNPLPDAGVTFTVTAGEGRLSGRFTVEHATTDAGGRAELILTPGPRPGPNIVGVSLGGRELVTFLAEGVGTAVAELEGDYRTWHLPTAATARLGKGAMGQGDRAVALSADGRCLAVASAIGVWLYEAATSRAQALLPTERSVHSVAFSLDGTLAAGLDNGRVELWEVEAGERVGTLRHGDGGGVTVVFSTDGTRLASGSPEQGMKLWDVEGRRVVGTWEVPRGTEWYWNISVAFSPDGSRLVSGFQDRTVRLWDVTTQMEVGTLEGHTDRVMSVSFSPDGTLLASGAGRGDPTVRLWDAATQTEIATLRGHTDEVRSVSFSPDGRLLASGGGWDDRTIRLWDVAAREETATLEEHGGGIRSVAFSRDGATLVSGAVDGTVLLRDVETGNAVSLSGHGILYSMAFSPDGVLLASGHEDGAVRLWDAVTRTPIATLEGHAFGVGSVSFSSDGALLASGSSDRTVKLWDVETRGLLGTLEGHAGRVTSVSFSPDGATVASAGGWDATVRLWDVATREQIGVLEGHTNSVESVAFSPDGALLASGGGWEDKTVKLWDVRTRELIGTLEGHEEGVGTVAFSPDGKTLASGSDGVRLWDVATGAPVATLPNRSSAGSVAFSPDGKSMVSGSWRRVTLWDVDSRSSTATLAGHTGGVHSVAFSRDGATLASGARDGTMLLWNLQPQPHSLTQVPGGQPQGAAGTALGEPFVVRVLDQYGNPLAGATVTFAVTAGGGTLSVTTAATDAEGRAATTLTLGRQPGTNTVEATVDGLEPVVFNATGVAMARTLNKPSGDEQEGEAGAALGEPFVVEVRDQNGNPLAGVQVTFAVTAGGGSLSATTVTTNTDGRASITLILGNTPGTNTVRATVAGLQSVTFTATAKATPDFDGDGATGFSDFFLFAEAFGGTDPRFDLDGSGTVDFTDFFLFAESFGQPARARLVALARKRIGLPDGPQLRQNAPNPFNSGTVITWFQLQPGTARVEVFALTGQRVVVLSSGHHKAGLHRLHWDGRDERGRLLASGVYVYRLVTAEGAWTRKLTLLR